MALTRPRTKEYQVAPTVTIFHAFTKSFMLHGGLQKVVLYPDREVKPSRAAQTGHKKNERNTCIIPPKFTQQHCTQSGQAFLLSFSEQTGNLSPADKRHHSRRHQSPHQLVGSGISELRAEWEGGGRGVQDWKHVYTRGGFMLMYGKTKTIL